MLLYIEDCFNLLAVTQHINKLITYFNKQILTCNNILTSIACVTFRTATDTGFYAEAFVHTLRFTNSCNLKKTQYLLMHKICSSGIFSEINFL